MCPLRFILVFISAALAGYFAWKNLRTDGELISDGKDENTQPNDAFEHASFLQKATLNTKTMFWALFDMASGKYLWRTWASRADNPPVKTEEKTQ